MAAVNPNQVPPQPPLITDLRVDSGGVNEAPVWDELLPYLALGYAPGATSGDQGLCGLDALTKSLNAVRIMNEGLDPRYIHYSFSRVQAAYNSSNYRDEANRKAREFSTIPGSNPQQQDAVLYQQSLSSLISPNWLDVENISTLLDEINIDLGTEYRLGYITTGNNVTQPTARIHDTMADGPVVWLHINPGVHWESMVPDQALAPGTGYLTWNVGARIALHVAPPRFLRRVIIEQLATLSVAAVPGVAAVDDHMGVLVGQWVKQLPNPPPIIWTPPSNAWIWGELPPLRAVGPGNVQAANFPILRRRGPVRLASLSPSIVVVPQGPKPGIPVPIEILGSNLRSPRARRSKPSFVRNRGPRWREGHPDPSRRQPSFSDPPGTLRMYFAIEPMENRDPRSTWLAHGPNALLLKVDHEWYGAPRMRTMDLIEGYVPLKNLERIRRPWGVQLIVPTRGTPAYDRMRYMEIKPRATRTGTSPTVSMIGIKSAVLSRGKQLQQAADPRRGGLDIRKLNEAFTPTANDYDATLLKATRGCEYVRYVSAAANNQSNVMNIDGYAATINDTSLDPPEPNHWGISIDPASLPFAQLPNSPEPVKGPISPDFAEDLEDEDPPESPGSQGSPGPPGSPGNSTRSLLDAIIDGHQRSLKGYQRSLALAQANILSMPPDTDTSAERAEVERLLGHIRQVNGWLADTQRARLSATNRFSIKAFVGQVVISGMLGCAACHVFGLWPFKIQQVYAMTIPNVVEDSFLKGPTTLGIGSSQVQYPILESNPVVPRKRSFEEVESGGEEEAPTKRMTKKLRSRK